ncbi:hypothetical protein [Kribbella sp. NPDC000426]|uniref:hypothetical protein n=1 Tax=Kribbella sp. NPDC000426 TaxID=3154255 RepID=UPI00332DF313
MTADQEWLKLDAGSEYDARWRRYFSLREEERVTKLAEDLVPQAQQLASATHWHSVSADRDLWIILVLHKTRDRLIRNPNRTDAGRPYVETVLPWSRYVDLPSDQQERVILERVDAVLVELARQAAEIGGSPFG